METASKSIYNWRRYPSSNCYEIDENMRLRIWLSAVVPSDIAEKNHNMAAQLQSLLYTKSPKIFWEYYFLWELAHTNLLSQLFFDYKAKIDNCCKRYIVTCGKKIYRCTYTFLSLKCCGEILLKSFCYLYEFPPSFHNFRPNIVAPPGNGNGHSIVHLKGQSFWKRVKTVSKSTHKSWHNTCSDQAWQRKNTIFWHLQPVHVFDLPQTLYGDRGRHAHSNWCQSFFNPTHSFPTQAKMLIFGHWRAD